MSASERVSKKVRAILEERGVEVAVLPDGFQIASESTAVNVTIVDQGDRTLVSLYAPLLRELPPSPDLFEYVATQGQEYYFGAMHYLPDVDGGLLLLEYTLLGDFLDPDELHAVVDALAVVGDREDDELQERFGGKRFIDD